MDLQWLDMNAEIQGRLVVVMIVSLLAFGFGTSSILIAGAFIKFNTTNTLNTPNTGEFPITYTGRSTNNIQNTASTSTNQPIFNQTHQQPPAGTNNNPNTGYNNTNTKSTTY